MWICHTLNCQQTLTVILNLDRSTVVDKGKNTASILRYVCTLN